MSHLRDAHPEYQAIYDAAHAPSTTTTLDFMIDKKSYNVFRWIEWICMDEIELAFVGKTLTRHNSNLEPISVNTFKKYAGALTRAVETRVAANLDNTPFAVVFDGWTENTHHFVGLFATVPTAMSYDTMLLSFEPLLDETSMTAEIHKTFILKSLQHYMLDRTKVESGLVALIGDNCTTNVALARLMSRPLVGCSSHRLNLGVEKYLKNSLGNELNKVQAIMVKLRNVKASGQLRLTTMLRPVLRNETRWTGASTKLNRFVKFMSLKAIDHTDATYAAPMPTHLELLRIDSVVAELKLFMSMTKKLQTRNITMSNVRYLFDAAILRHPFLDNFVGPTCKNVSSPMFESAIVKIQASCENQLTPEERK
ncbi:hypothetical protein DYB34_013738 [Aphanomyces astaci]|uniref:Uncharacterized protein n=1 Tax=Aphanomyces astaci TaxID=112090 RepID=A0A418C3D8_APHAT|nr:hypothetical protein DYB34_013738 [Aphanomyces astaci]